MELSQTRPTMAVKLLDDVIIVEEIIFLYFLCSPVLLISIRFLSVFSEILGAFSTTIDHKS